MATLYFCADDTGQIGTVITGSDAQIAAQPAREGFAAIVLADGLVGDPYGAAPDFTALDAWLRQAINDSFNAFVVQIVSNLIGQDRRYTRKETEALIYTAGDEAAHPEKYAYMIGEAHAKTLVLGRAVGVAEVRAGIVAQIAQSAVDPALEGFRVAHRQAVVEAATLPAKMAAAAVDWAAIVAAVQEG